MADKLTVLTGLIEPIVAALDCELWGIEYLPGGRQHRATLRVYIDASQGVGIDDCEKVSRQVSSMLDVEDPITGEYTLEVSSPGMDRPLFTLAQFKSYVGEKAKIKLRTPFEGRRNYTGIIKGIEDSDVVLEVDENEFLLPIDAIDKAAVVPNFGAAQRR